MRDILLIISQYCSSLQKTKKYWGTVQMKTTAMTTKCNVQKKRQELRILSGKRIVSLVNGFGKLDISQIGQLMDFA